MIEESSKNTYIEKTFMQVAGGDGARRSSKKVLEANIEHALNSGKVVEKDNSIQVKFSGKLPNTV